MDIHNLVFINDPIRIRELNPGDCGVIREIAEDYSICATFRFYTRHIVPGHTRHIRLDK